MSLCNEDMMAMFAETDGTRDAWFYQMMEVINRIQSENQAKRYLRQRATMNKDNKRRERWAHA